MREKSLVFRDFGLDCGLFLCVVLKISVRKLCFRTDCGGRNRTRTCDPIDVNDVLWAGGRVVKLLPSGVHMSQTS